MAIKFLNTVAVDTDVLYVDASSNRVGIGTTSPSYKLDVNGSIASSVSSGFPELRLSDAVSDFIITTNSQGEGVIKTEGTSKNIRFFNNSGETMRISGNGNVGIGTTSPGAKLDVVSGDIRLGTNATYFRVRDTASAQPRVLGMNTSNTFYIGPIDSYAGGAIAYGVSGNVSYHGFYGGGSEKVRITSSGSVGIGTTSPSYTLDVNGVIRGEQILYLKDTGGTNRLTIQAESSYVTQSVGALAQNFVANYYRFYDDAFSEMMRIADNGNVGIGTTAPAQKLHVIGNSEITGDIFLGRYIFHNDDTNTWIGFPSNDTFTIRTNGSDRVRVTSGGNFGIGTASPTSIFHVKQTLASPSVPMVYFEADRGPSAYGAVNVRVDNLDYGTGMRFYRSGTYDSTAIGFINGSSTVGSITISTSSTSYNTTSDYRLKENVTSITDGIARVKQLKPKRFNFIGDTSVVDGFIAHEAQVVVPEAVTGEKDEVLPNGDPLYQGIDQAKVVPLLTAALQEAITKIEQLETRIQTLELD
jgi:hypothetical protein